MGVVLKTFELIFWETGLFGGWEKLVCGCQGEEPAFDFKLGNCFVILVEGQFITEVTDNFNRGDWLWLQSV